MFAKWNKKIEPPSLTGGCAQTPRTPSRFILVLDVLTRKVFPDFLANLVNVFG